MEANPGGCGEGRVRMVNLVKAPEKRHTMVGPVPEIRDEVQDDDSDRDAEPLGRRNRVQHADAVGSRPAGDRARACSACDSNDDEVGEPEAAVHGPTAAQPSVWPETLEQDRERQGGHEPGPAQQLKLALAHRRGTIASPVYSASPSGRGADRTGRIGMRLRKAPASTGPCSVPCARLALPVGTFLATDPSNAWSASFFAGSVLFDPQFGRCGPVSDAILPGL